MPNTKFKMQNYNSKFKQSLPLLSKGKILNFILVFLAFDFYFLILSTPVYAHILKTDGSIGAVLHIDPEDDPIAGQQAGFFFEFKDTKNQFQPQKCNCVFSVLENGAQIYTQPLFQNNLKPSLTSASVFYTFSGKDVYQVRVVGAPTVTNGFQPFTLIYDIRVSREGALTAAGAQVPAAENWIYAHIILIVGAAILTIFLIGVLFKQKLAK